MSSTITHVEGRFAGSGGLELFRQSWRPAVTPKAVLVNLHGLGDHSGLYPELVEYMVARELAVHTFDLRGNGRCRKAWVVEKSEHPLEGLTPLLAVVDRTETPAVRSFFSETAWAGSSPSTTRPAGPTACVG